LGDLGKEEMKDASMECSTREGEEERRGKRMMRAHLGTSDFPRVLDHELNGPPIGMKPI